MGRSLKLHQAEAVDRALENLQNALDRATYARISDLCLSLEPNGLIISGRSQTYYDKQLVQHVVKQLTELKLAENRIEVEPRVRRTPSESPVRHTSFRSHVTRSPAGAADPIMVDVPY